MVAGYKEAKATADKLEKQIDELQKQLAKCREVQNRLGAGLSSKTKATFLVQSMVAASRPALEIAEASIHQGVLLQKELSIKKTKIRILILPLTQLAFPAKSLLRVSILACIQSFQF
ncbi:unnamed protein product [Prunus brigantina]